MKTYMSAEDYAEHIRQETGPLMAQLLRALGPEHPATIKVIEINSEAVAIVNGTQMEQERAGLDALDLATLPAPKD
jgi:hypothetical protein